MLYKLYLFIMHICIYVCLCTCLYTHLFVRIDVCVWGLFWKLKAEYKIENRFLLEISYKLNTFEWRYACAFSCKYKHNLPILTSLTWSLLMASRAKEIFCKHSYLLQGLSTTEPMRRFCRDSTNETNLTPFWKSARKSCTTSCWFRSCSFAQFVNVVVWMENHSTFLVWERLIINGEFSVIFVC